MVFHEPPLASCFLRVRSAKVNVMLTYQVSLWFSVPLMFQVLPDRRNNNYISSGQGTSTNDTDGNRQVCPSSGQPSNETITWNDRFNPGMVKKD